MLAIGAVISMEILSIVVLSSPFRLDPISPLWKSLSTVGWIQITVVLTFTFILFVLTWAVSSYAQHYDRGTVKILKQYAELHESYTEASPSSETRQ